MNSLNTILADWYPDGNFTEDELWYAIAESEGVDPCEIMDGDITDYL